MNDVRLRDVIEADLPILFEQQLDPEANRMAAFPARDRETFTAHWTKILGDATVTRKTILFNGQVAGNIVSFEQSGKPLVGYWIGKNYWGRGIATRALSEFLGLVPARPLYAHVAKHNVGSIRVLEKCGFKPSDQNAKPSHAGDGDEVEEVVMELALEPTRRKLNPVFETDRLILRRLSTDDAEFILELVNDPAWLRFIGDRGVKTLDDARDYIRKGPIESYARRGFGLYAVERKEGGSPIGICGLVKRDFLEDVDIGFALLPEFRGKGYAHEAARATMSYAREVVGLDRIVAITSPDNDASARLLEKIGLRFERMIRISPDSPEEVRLYASADRSSGNLRALD